MTGVTFAIVGWLLGAGTDPLKGCLIYGPAFGLDRDIRCKAFQIEVYPPMPLALEKTMLSEQARAASSGTDAKEILSVGEVKVAGKPRPAFRYLKRKNDGTRDVGLVSTVPVGKDSFRIVHCTQGLEAGCPEVFALVEKKLPPVTGGAPKRPTFAGQPLAVPKGCSRAGPSQLSCGATELAWTKLYPGAPETLEQAEPMLRRANAHLGALTATDRYCELQKVDALCRVGVLTAPDGSKTFLTYAIATVRDEAVWVQCTSKVEPQDGLPAPCGQVMAFKPRTE